MTTARFSALVRPTGEALASIKNTYCRPPAYRPTERVESSMRCPKCGGSLRFTVSAVNGLTTGRCSSINCLAWSGQ